LFNGLIRNRMEVKPWLRKYFKMEKLKLRFES